MPIRLARVAAESSVIAGCDVAGALDAIRWHYPAVVIMLGTFSPAWAGLTTFRMRPALSIGLVTLLNAHPGAQFYRVVEPECSA